MESDRRERGAPFLILDVDETILHSTMRAGELLPPNWLSEETSTRLSEETSTPAFCSRSPRATNFRRVNRNPDSVFVSENDVINAEYFVSQIRPGIRQGLLRLASQFNLCLCSFGLAPYLDTVVSALDPVGLIFGNRVLDRTNFPGGVKRVPREWGEPEDVVVIDDQPGVWEDRAVVIRVRPYKGDDRCTDDDERSYVDNIVMCLEDMLDSYNNIRELNEAASSAVGVRREEFVGSFGKHVLLNWPCTAVAGVVSIGPPVPKAIKAESDAKRESAMLPDQGWLSKEPIPVLGLSCEEKCENDGEPIADDDPSLVETEEGCFHIQLDGSNDDVLRTVTPITS